MTPGVTEIRHFGAGSVQVARRLRAMLEHLVQVLPPCRVPRLLEDMSLLQNSVMRSFADPEDQQRGMTSDLQGLGGIAGEPAAPGLEGHLRVGSDAEAADQESGAHITSALLAMASKNWRPG